MLRTIPVWVLLIGSVAIVCDAKPIFIKVFSPNVYTSQSASSSSSQTTVPVSPISTQLISNLISQKLRLLSSLLQAKSSGGGFGFGFSKFVTFSTTTTTTEKPFTYHTTEVNTDFTKDVSLSTQSVYTTTTTEGNIKTPKPTIYPQPAVSSAAPVIIETLETTTRGTNANGYTYHTAALNAGPTYIPPSSVSTSEDSSAIFGNTVY